MTVHAELSLDCMNVCLKIKVKLTIIIQNSNLSFRWLDYNPGHRWYFGVILKQDPSNYYHEILGYLKEVVVKDEDVLASSSGPFRESEAKVCFLDEVSILPRIAPCVNEQALLNVLC